MESFKTVPTLLFAKDVPELIEHFHINSDDLIFMSQRTYNDYFASCPVKLRWMDYRKYTNGEPTDEMVENMAADLQDKPYNRVFAIGGGTILDVAKLFALKKLTPVCDLFHKAIPAEKEHELILIPTTCGTGSEVTNISILELIREHTKMGLADDALYADYAVLIPSLLNHLPLSVLGTSSADALVHAMESYTSPKATHYSRLCSKQAMKGILKAYRKMVSRKMKPDEKILSSLLYASTLAGIAFGNAGCATVHALSYPLGARYHVPHGQSNYEMLFPVYRMYEKKDPEGPVARLKIILSNILECDPEDAFLELDHLLSYFVERRSLKGYGVPKEELCDFTQSVIASQQRLLQNSPMPLTEAELLEIYENAY